MKDKTWREEIEKIVKQWKEVNWVDKTTARQEKQSEHITKWGNDYISQVKMEIWVREEALKEIEKIKEES